MYGAAAEIIAGVAETHGPAMKSAPARVTWPHGYVGSSRALDEAFYPTSADIVAACRKSMAGSATAN
jgi:hypothetical protein